MSGVAAYGADIKKSGTSTSFTDEAMSNTTGNTWQIDDASKEVFDRDTVPTFYDNSVEIDTADISSINYLYGSVTFTGSKSGPITVDGDYMPMASIAGAKDVSLNRTAAILDDTDISNSGCHTKEYGIRDVSVTVGRWDDVAHTFTDILAARTPVVIEIAPTSSKSYRGWFVVSGSSGTLDINTLLEESITFELDGDDETGKTFSRSDL